ncbi:MAG: phosphotransferase [Alphaproteobacteria bacterium]|nr:phosphotransferase [Alphaproteobacteria bacterium]
MSAIPLPRPTGLQPRLCILKVDVLLISDQIPTHEAVAKAALSAFDLPEVVALGLINLSENATYKIELKDGQKFALRVHRQGYHSHGAIQSELAWLIDLRVSQVAVTPLPVAGRDGALIQHVMGHHVVLFQWEVGVEPGIKEDLIRPFEQLGAIAAAMHAHVRLWKKPDTFQRFTWDFETSLSGVRPHWGRWQGGMGVDATRLKLFGRTVDVIGRRLQKYGKGPERFGLIHGDLRLANLLIDGPTVKVIDFDDCGFGWHMYDAATPISFYEHVPQVPELIDAWTRGYRSVAPLAKADEDEIPTFVMLRRLLLVAWIGSHQEAPFPRSLGVAFTEQTDDLCDRYLLRFG